MIRLLLSTVPSARRLVPTGHGVVTVTFFALVAGLEVLGRSATSDLHDGLAALVLGSAVALVATRHRRDPLPWLAWLMARAGGFGTRLLDRIRYDHGLDLRGAPKLPRRLPPATWAVTAGLTVWAALAALSWYVLPVGWREVGLGTSYVAYLVVLLAVWGGLLVCTFVGVYVPVLLLDHWLKAITRASDRRFLELLLLFAYGMLVISVAYWVPTIVVLGLCLAVTAVAAAVGAKTGGEDEPAVLWRAGSGRPIFAVPLRRLVAGGLGLTAFVVFNLLLTACGGRLLAPPEPSDAMPVTGLLGTMAAWMVPGLVAAAALRLWAGRRIDPARRTPPTVHLTGHHVPAEDRKRALDTIVGWGWKVRHLSEEEADPGDVKVELVSAERSEATEFEPRWPLKLSLEDLTSGRVRDRLARRDEIQLRRQMFRGVATLFKRAAAERAARGGGHWFAPHWWFITGLDREEPTRGRADRPTPPRPVGPPYHKTFPPRVRQHLFEVLRAVEVDMVYVDDGVGPRSVARVLRAVFELYDRHGGQRKADDHCFRGLPKVRVMLHNYAPGRPFKATGYREPKYDDLSRIRVLHIFRDHGGHEANVEEPFDFSWEPSPILGAG